LAKYSGHQVYYSSLYVSIRKRKAQLCRHTNVGQPTLSGSFFYQKKEMLGVDWSTSWCQQILICESSVIRKAQLCWHTNVGQPTLSGSFFLQKKEAVIHCY